MEGTNFGAGPEEAGCSLGVVGFRIVRPKLLFIVEGVACQGHRRVDSRVIFQRCFRCCFLELKVVLVGISLQPFTGLPWQELEALVSSNLGKQLHPCLGAKFQ